MYINVLYVTLRFSIYRRSMLVGLRRYGVTVTLFCTDEYQMGNWAYVIRVPNTKYGGAAGQSAPKGTARVMMRSPASAMFMIVYLVCTVVFVVFALVSRQDKGNP